MAQQAERIRQQGLKGFDAPSKLAPGDPITKGVSKQAKKLDKRLQEKGAFLESNLSEAEREAEAATKKQEQLIGKQRQQEKLRLAETEDEIARRKLLRKVGGRRALIASR